MGLVRWSMIMDEYTMECGSTTSAMGRELKPNPMEISIKVGFKMENPKASESTTGPTAKPTQGIGKLDSNTERECGLTPNGTNMKDSGEHRKLMEKEDIFGATGIHMMVNGMILLRRG